MRTGLRLSPSHTLSSLCPPIIERAHREKSAQTIDQMYPQAPRKQIDRFGQDNAVVPGTSQLSPNLGEPPQLAPFVVGPCPTPLPASHLSYRPVFNSYSLLSPPTPPPPTPRQPRRRRKPTEVIPQRPAKIRILLPPNFEGDDWQPYGSPFVLDYRHLSAHELHEFYKKANRRSIADVEKDAERAEFAEDLYKSGTLRDLLFAESSDSPNLPNHTTNQFAREPAAFSGNYTNHN